MKMAIQSGLSFPLQDPEILIEKGARLLTLKAKGKVLKTYRVGLGAAPELDKIREGDHRTPEGRFYVCSRNAQSPFHLFLGLSYPNAEDADRGVKDKLISATQRQTILHALRTKSAPPQFTKLGGLVGIHGGGDNSDWTWGCIALSNEGIEEVWIACPMGTPIEIRK
jgi:murein L,D-transpeptidase YafK